MIPRNVIYQGVTAEYASQGSTTGSAAAILNIKTIIWNRKLLSIGDIELGLETSPARCKVLKSHQHRPKSRKQLTLHEVSASPCSSALEGMTVKKEQPSWTVKLPWSWTAHLTKVVEGW